VIASPADIPAVTPSVATRVTESPEWPTVFHPPGVIRIVTPAEEQADLDRELAEIATARS
jgi:hypothetical protein